MISSRVFSFLIFSIGFAANFCYSAQSVAPATCLKWFSVSKIQSGKGCTISCAALDTDMATFDCARFCDRLCGSGEKADENSFGFQLSAIYPGLTEAERKFIDSNPAVAAKAYWLSWRAEKLCNQIFTKSDTNDESDACRHFMWAALLNQSVGAKLASEILDAHEQNAIEPETEKAMDLANNRRGLIVSGEMIKEKKLGENDFLEQFRRDLKDGKLIVIKQRSK